MANELRVRANFLTGTTTDIPLTNVATTINSPAFASLPVIGATQHLVLVLDPLATAGAPEIVYVTAHTASATSVTVLRAQEGTVARQHNSGTTWRHGATAQDFSRVWDPPACRVFNSAALPIANATETTLTFNSERYDTDNMHSTSVNTSRITFNTAGIYVVSAMMEFAANATGQRYAYIWLNGTTLLSLATFGQGAGGGWATSLTTQYKFSVSDYVEVRVRQDSGGTLNITTNAAHTPEFSAVWVGNG